MSSCVKTPAIAWVLLSCVASLPAIAAPIDVQVNGTITPAACTPLLGNGGAHGYGDIQPGSLSKTEYTPLPAIETPFQITCDGLSKVALTARTLRPNTVATHKGFDDFEDGSALSPITLLDWKGATAFGLGLHNGNERIGGYTMLMDTDSLTLDGAPGFFIENRGDDKWRGNGMGWLFMGGLKWFASFSSTGQIAPTPFRVMKTTMRMQAYINKTSELSTAAALELDGAAAIDLVYL